MATASIPLQFPDDITECPFCHNTLEHPKQLPCFHSFCLKCIEGWLENKKHDSSAAAAAVDKLECPLCEIEFSIGERGLDGLPADFFLEKLIHVKQLTSKLSQKEIMCELCSGDQSATEGERVRQRNAIVYCTECCASMCAKCRRHHQKFRLFSSHRLAELGKDVKLEEVMAMKSMPESKCDKHADECLKFYCLECKMAACITCIVAGHNPHKFSDIKDVFGDLKQQLVAAENEIVVKAAECQKMLDKIGCDVSKFIERTEQIEKEIIDKAEEMKKLIEDRKSKLLSELDDAKAKQLTQMKRVRQDVERRMAMMKNFNRYIDELKNNGSDCEVARSAGVVKQRTNELMQFDVEAVQAETVRSSVEIKFSSTGSVDSLQQVLGKIIITSIASNTIAEPVNAELCTKPWKILPSTGNDVAGIATLDQEVFVVRFNNKHVDVYDASTLSSINRTLPLDANSTGYNMSVAACSVNKCIYVSDRGGKRIQKTSITLGQTAAESWPVEYQPRGLSVNAENNILVACSDGNRIQEFTCIGKLVRQIVLGTGFTHVTHVRQLSNGHYGVTHHHRYCVVDANGLIVRSYGGIAGGSGDGQLQNPYCFTVDMRGYVLIADWKNNRIVELDPITFAAKTVNLELLDSGMKKPHGIHFDKLHSRLYIGEWCNDGSGRIIVLEYMK